MENKDPGYIQAVQNMAHRISFMSERDFDPLHEIYGDDKEAMLEHFHNNGELEYLKEWIDIEHVADVVCSTYDVEYPTFMADVWNYMVVMVVANPELSH